MMEAWLTSFATFFATVGPIEAAVLFATFTASLPRERAREIAVRAVLIATLILMVFTLFGQPLLAQLGVSIAALQTAGGFILGVIALEMIFARKTSAFRLTAEEDAEAGASNDLAVFPLATPLLAGPGAMSAGIVLAANAAGDGWKAAGVVAGLSTVMVVTLGLLLAAPEIARGMGKTAQNVLIRVFGILLAAIAVQAVFDGLNASGLVGRAAT
ncbi:MAG: MarC family protein [Hyphomicrobiaceae bacterium]|nr:MarC family protein [Hyphomicrobiaceae bacterium]